MITTLDLTYDVWVKPVQSNFRCIELDKESIERVECTAEKIADVKRLEQGYLVDKDSLVKRWCTGLGGEVVLGIDLRVTIMDSTVGPSTEYDIGDLKKIGFNIGVKSVEYNKFPLIHSNPKRCEIILLKHPKKYLYMICGIYTPQTMLRFSSRDLVIDPKVRDSKTGFYGIPFYKPFTTLEDLKKYT